MKYHLILGDCRDKLKTLPGNSIDSVVTDPPYELGFMGKGWDKSGIAYDVNVWREVLRVLKPGGHLLAFGGTRTHHRMTCAIEDAGFEIRDELDWLYSTGFPKSLNIGCDCRGDAEPYTLNREYEETKHDLPRMSESDVSSAVSTQSGEGSVLFPSVSEQGASPSGRTKPPTTKIRRRQSGLEGGSDLFSETRQLQTHQVCEVSAIVHSDGTQRRLRDGASPIDGAETLSLSDADGSGASHQSQSTGQSHRELGTFPEQPGAQVGRVETCPQCGKIRSRSGWGTALKPAREPIILARKPVEGTVANNVLTHGTGALNIDACRIGYQSDTDKESATPQGRCTAANAGAVPNVEASTRAEFERPELKGRWPANVLFDEDAAAELDEQSGIQKDGVAYEPAGKQRNSMYVAPDYLGRQCGYGGIGGASRFFYVAKASRKEREAGCEDLPVHTAGEATGGREEGSAGINNPRAGAGRTAKDGVHNYHPTVKPIALMRYLCKLVTPPNGIVLDPFLGSGTTGIAAVLEEYRFIGIELDEGHMEIAKARIKHWDAPSLW